MRCRRCGDCRRVFRPSSGHHHCPSCRSKSVCSCGRLKQLKSRSVTSKSLFRTCVREPVMLYELMVMGRLLSSCEVAIHFFDDSLEATEVREKVGGAIAVGWHRHPQHPLHQP
jgi:hypothetical protein